MLSMASSSHWDAPGASGVSMKVSVIGISLFRNSASCAMLFCSASIGDAAGIDEPAFVVGGAKGGGVERRSFSDDELR